MTRRTIKCEAIIRYEPLADEVNYATLALFDANVKVLTLPSSKTTNPFEWAERCTTQFRNIIPCILIPGQLFDLNGTRQGRGHGWYDRFLSKVPSSWIRIGITDLEHLSFTPLMRKPLDEPVDRIIVCGATTWRIHETHARI